MHRIQPLHSSRHLLYLAKEFQRKGLTLSPLKEQEVVTALWPIFDDVFGLDKTQLATLPFLAAHENVSWNRRFSSSSALVLSSLIAVVKLRTTSHRAP